MRRSSYTVAALAAVLAISSACVIENAASPPPLPPAPRRVLDASLDVVPSVPEAATPEAAAVIEEAAASDAPAD